MRGQQWGFRRVLKYRWMAFRVKEHLDERGTLMEESHSQRVSLNLNQICFTVKMPRYRRLAAQDAVQFAAQFAVWVPKFAI